MSGNTYGTDFLLDPNYQEGIDRHVLEQVRPEDRFILDVGCRNGEFAAKLKQMYPGRTVFGIASLGYDTTPRSGLFEALYHIDIERELPPIPPKSLDCIVLNGVLPQMRDPGQVLARLKPFLRDGGRMICTIPNAQHFSVLASLVSGDFQPQKQGALQAENNHLFGAANIQKLCLDAGLMPLFTNSLQMAIPAATSEAYLPVLKHLQLNPDAFNYKASIYQYVCVASPMRDVQPTTGGITFIAAVNNFRQLQDNLLASPALQNARHEVIPVTGATSAADAFKKGLRMSSRKNALYVLLHQDIYLPAGWDDRLISGIAAAEQKYGPVGIAGVFGVVRTPAGSFERAGNVLDRHALLATGHQMPARAVSLDEIVLALPVQNGSLVGFEEELGFHMYGSEVCLAAEDAGQAAVIVDAPCLHNSESSDDLSSNGFLESVQAFARKRSKQFPYASTCVQIRADGMVMYW